MRLTPHQRLALRYHVQGIALLLACLAALFVAGFTIGYAATLGVEVAERRFGP